MTATSPIGRAAVRMAGRWRAALAAATCAVAVAGVLTAGLAAPASAAAAKSPWSVQAVPPVDTSTPSAQFQDGSCPTATSCVAVGEYVGTDGIMRTFAERWNGSTWRIVNPANPSGAAASSLGAVSCAGPSSCQAIGSTRKGVTAGPLIAESWTGTRWRMAAIAQPGNASLDSVSCPAPGSCLAVGERTTSNGTDQAVAERWDGHRWTQVTPRRPLALSELNGVSCPRARDCYAVGWTSASRTAAGRPLIEHWTGSKWTVLTVAHPASKAQLTSISCPTTSSCTAVGSSGTNSIRMLVEDLAKGRWTESLPAAPSQADGGTASLYRVSCSAPRVCTALFSYIDNGEELTWGTAARGASGGFKFTIPAGDVAQDNANAVSCRTAGCTIVGSLNSNDGQGDSNSSGTPFAWRGSGGHFTPQVVPAPAGTAGGALTSVSCTASGFCAAATQAGDQFDTVLSGDPSVLVRQKAGGPWTAPPNTGSGFLTSVSCTSSSFCLATGSPAGAERWDGHQWSQLSAPDPFDPDTDTGLQSVSCVSPTFCLAVGSPKTGNGTALAATWNGASWTMLTPARPAGSAGTALAGVSCASTTNCVAAGYYVPTPGAFPRMLTEVWNGTSWKIGSPDLRVNTDNPLHISVSCASATACMVTWGSFGEALSRWWNGSKWTAPAFVGPKPRSQVTSIYGVSCTSKTACTAVGSFSYSSGSGPLVQNWNGAKWSVTPAPNPAGGIGSFNAVSCTSATACTAVGSAERIETVPFAEVRG
jgi:hypothetical protein